MNNSNLPAVYEEVLVEHIKDDVYDIWLLDDLGEKRKHICGYPKTGVPTVLAKQGLKKDMVCNLASGWGTSTSVGFCTNHIDKRLNYGAKNFYSLAKMYAEDNTLTEVLEDIEKTDIVLNDVSGEIMLLSAMQLQLMKWIESHPDADTGVNWSPTRIGMMTTILKDIIRAKETASRIEGSMRLELSTLRSVVEMIMSFLMKELKANNIPKDVIVEIFSKMTDELFIPLTNQAMITDKKNSLNLRTVKSD